MGRVLPILFNTEMVRAILENRKGVTRRAVKYKHSNTEMKMRTDKYGTRLIEIQKDIEGETHGKHPDGRTWHKLLPYIEKNPPCRKGDILYVRETWAQIEDIPYWNEYYREGSHPISPGEYVYKADNMKVDGILPEIKWRPSIHMPYDAARIWLKVTDVRVERLQDITNEQVLREGANIDTINHLIKQMPEKNEDFIRTAYLTEWSWIWASAIKKSDFGCYGYDANPWVWVIEFERCEKPEVAT